MKKILLIMIGLLLVTAVNAQEKKTSYKDQYTKFTQMDRIVLNVYTDIWINEPKDSIDIKPMNIGADFYLMQELPFGQSNFSLAGGIGVGSHNLYSDAMPVKNFSIDTTTGGKIYDGTTVFTKIPAYSTDGKQKIDYKKNKFTQVYFDIPIELRYRMKNNAFKVYLGGKFGFLMGCHTKYRGDDFTEEYPTGEIKFKEYKIANVQTVRYGLTARIGWKWVQAYGFFSLSNLFKKEKGPEMYPISVGLTLSPY